MARRRGCNECDEAAAAGVPCCRGSVTTDGEIKLGEDEEVMVTFANDEWAEEGGVHDVAITVSRPDKFDVTPTEADFNGPSDYVTFKVTKKAGVSEVPATVTVCFGPVDARGGVPCRTCVTMVLAC